MTHPILRLPLEIDVKLTTVNFIVLLHLTLPPTTYFVGFGFDVDVGFLVDDSDFASNSFDLDVNFDHENWHLTNSY